MSPAARACIRSLRLTKRALPLVSEFDCGEWGAACAFLAEAPRLRIRVLELAVVEGGGGVGEAGF